MKHVCFALLGIVYGQLNAADDALTQHSSYSQCFTTFTQESTLHTITADAQDNSEILFDTKCSRCRKKQK